MGAEGVKTEEALRPPLFLIDEGLWGRFNGELRSACHWCTHHHTTTPAEAAKKLERGEGWPRDWISRKVKNSTRQFGGLFICPAPDCPGYTNPKGERRRRWFCRFCINRHLGVDLGSFFLLDEALGRWVQAPHLICWHCQSKFNGAVGICVNCPQKHTKRAKWAREGQGVVLQHSLVGTAPHSAQICAATGVPVILPGATGNGACSEAREVDMEGAARADESPLAGEDSTRLLHTSAGAKIRQLPRAVTQKGLFSQGSQASVVPYLIDHLNASCTPFHATAEARRHLLEAGFVQLSEFDEWELQPGGCYFFTRNMSSVFAFAIGRKYKPGNGFNVIAAHIDSPCPKVKPISTAITGGFLHILVHPYGSGLWHTWFDRDLSIAGRVLRRKKNGELTYELVKVRRPILRIPSLGVYLNRSAPCERSKKEVEPELAPILASQIEAELTVSAGSSFPTASGNGSCYPSSDVHHPLLLQVLANELQCDVCEIVDFELSIYDTQPACIGGAKEEFVFSGRLDNIASSFCALWALLATCSSPLSLIEESSVRMVALYDSGEVGVDAGQSVGARVMYQTMTRIARWLARDLKSEGVVERSMQHSFIVSADMAHALHPNNADSHVHSHQPRLQNGIVIKHHPLQSNSMDRVAAFLFREVARRNSIRTQSYAVMSDMGCCSTINPLIMAGYGLRIVDCGLPQLSMHSVREMCGTEDINSAFRHFQAFFHEIVSMDAQLRVDS